MFSIGHGDDLVSTGTAHGRAIVIGGGISGIIASRVLADHFDRVLVLERDRYPHQPGFR